MLLQLTIPVVNPAILAFCLCQLIVAVLLLSGGVLSNKQPSFGYIANGEILSGNGMAGLEDGIGDDEMERKDPDKSDDDGNDECEEEDDDDELSKRVEDFIERMNRKWRAEEENV